MTIVNLTQHYATPDQIAAGVIDLNNPKIEELLTFNTLDSVKEKHARAKELAQIALQSGATQALLGGAPFFMSAMENALTAVGIESVYAFSVRESVETTAPDGSTIKQSVFKHLGFV